jgi:hypothetical protein
MIHRRTDDGDVVHSEISEEAHIARAARALGRRHGVRTELAYSGRGRQVWAPRKSEAETKKSVLVSKGLWRCVPTFAAAAPAGSLSQRTAHATAAGDMAGTVHQRIVALAVGDKRTEDTRFMCVRKLRCNDAHVFSAAHARRAPARGGGCVAHARARTCTLAPLAAAAR